MPSAKVEKTSKRKRVDSTAEKFEPPVEDIQKSVLSSIDDTAFPRGGSHALTPLEYKEAANEAAKDALFEDQENHGSGNKEIRSKGKRRKVSKSDAKSKTKDQAKKTPIEGLTSKNIVPGTVLLGQISEIGSIDMTLSLSDNLSGYIPITSISSKTSALLEQIREEEEESDSESAKAEIVNTLPHLKDIFSVGQWLRAKVVSTISESARDGKKKKRIELTIDPEIVNQGITVDDVRPGTIVQAQIRSEEDHGYIADVLIDGLSGFIRKEKGSSPTFQENQVVLLSVKSKSSNKRVIDLEIPSAKHAMNKIDLVDALLPGAFIEAVITEVRPNGLMGKALGLLNMTVELLQSGCWESSSLEETFKEGQTIKGRITALFDASEDRRIMVSLLQNVLDLSSSSTDMLTAYPISHYFDTAVVKHVTPAALFLDIGGTCLGYVHISRITGSAVDKISSTSGPFKNGTTHRARVIGYDIADNLIVLSMEKKVLDRKFLRIQDIPVGEVLQCTVDKIVPSGGIVLSVEPEITGFVPEVHISDAKLLHPERKYRPGVKVKARVLSNDKARKGLTLTLKKSIVNSEDTIITSYDVPVGSKCPATIISLKDNGAIVEFFNHVRAFLPVSEISEAFVENPKDHFTLGQSVAVKVFSVDPETKSMKVTCRVHSAEDKVKEEQDFESLEAGSIVSGSVIQKSKDNIVVELDVSRIKGIINVNSLSDGGPVKCKTVLKKLLVGSKLKEMVVLEKNNFRKALNLSLSISLINAVKEGKFPNTFADITIGKELYGRLKTVSQAGGFVCFAGRLTGLIPRKAMPEDYSSHVNNGFCTVYVTEIDVSQERFQLSFDKPKQMVKQPARTLTGKEKLDKKFDDLKVGEIVNGYIKNIADCGLFVVLGPKTIALVKIKDLSDSFLKDWKEHFKVRQEVKGKVMSKDPKKRRIELSLKQSDIESKSAGRLQFSQIEKGAIMPGVVKGVEDFGVFVLLDGTDNISGLCHRSELSDGKIPDARKLFNKGDPVKVKILSIDLDKKKLSLGLKASYFGEVQPENADAEEATEETDVEKPDESSDGEQEDSSDEEEDEEEEDVVMDLDGEGDTSASEGEESDDENGDEALELETGGFDWTAKVLDEGLSDEDEDKIEGQEKDSEIVSRKRRKHLKYQEDKTAEISSRAPQSVSDFERLLISKPNSSVVWINYMAFQLQLSEIDAARKIGQRALKAINFREEKEKLNIWIALLNLENSFGNDESLEETFRSACQYMNQGSVYRAMINIYIQSSKKDKADELLKIFVKKFSQDLRAWSLYASFLSENGKRDEFRSLLSRALQALPKKDHVELILKFVKLEFTDGEVERGRTLYEGILSGYPKRIDAWNVILDYEIKNGDGQMIEQLFERVIKSKLTMKQAKHFFEKWLKYEETLGDTDKAQKVKETAINYVSSRRPESQIQNEEKESESSEEEREEEDDEASESE